VAWQKKWRGRPPPGGPILWKNFRLECPRNPSPIFISLPSIKPNNSLDTPTVSTILPIKELIMTEKKLTDEQLARAKRLFRDGMSIDDIAALIVAEETEIEKETEKLSRKDIPWDEIELSFSTGFPIKKIAERYGISESTIKSKAKLNNWSIDAATAVIARSEAKLAGLADPAETIEKQKEAVDAAVDARTAVVALHRAEWKKHREWTETIRKEDDIAEYRKAKLAAETIKLRQAGERVAWGFEEAAVGGPISISWQE